MARLAGRAVAHARGRRPAAAVRRLGRRPDRLDRAARHGRLVARPRGAAANVPAGDVPRPRHDASAGDPRPGGEDRHRADALRRRFEVGLDPRDALAHRLLLGAEPERRAVGCRDRSRLLARGARAGARLRRDLRRRPFDRRALFRVVGVRDGAGGADGDRRGAAPGAGSGDGRRMPAGRGQPRPRARPLARRGLAGGPRQDLHRAARREASACGRSSCSPSRPASTARASSRPRGSRPTARTGRRRRFASPTSTSSDRSSSAGSSRPPSPGRSSSINPFDQPDVQAAKDKTTQILASGERSARRARGIDRRSCSRRRTTAITSASRRS